MLNRPVNGSYISHINDERKTNSAVSNLQPYQAIQFLLVHQIPPCKQGRIVKHTENILERHRCK